MTPQGRRLVENYRRAQTVLSLALAVRLRQLWPLLLGGPMDETADLWAAAAVAAAQVSHGRFADLAGGFYRRFGAAEGVAAVPVRASFDPPRANRLMLAAGPGLIRANLAKGLRFDDAARKAEYWANGAAVREATAGARETLRESSVSEGHGWARAAGGNACAFCAMLASRGAVYRREESAEFESHVNCGCFPVPVFDRRQGLPPNSDRYRDEWSRSDGTLEGFRRHLDEVRGSSDTEQVSA